jgi:hypothetical protein
MESLPVLGCEILKSHGESEIQVSFEENKLTHQEQQLQTPSTTTHD